MKKFAVLMIVAAGCIALTGCSPRGEKELEAGKRAPYGIGDEEIEYDSAYFQFEKSLQKGNREVNFYLGQMYDWCSYPTQDFGKAVEYYKACEDNIYSKISMGQLYWAGMGVPQDYESALALYEGAAKLGNEQAASNAAHLEKLMTPGY